MRFVTYNMVLAAWLLASAFAFGHGEESAAVTGLLAVLVGVFSLASPAVPGLRLANAAFALVLAWAALLMPEVSGAGRINNAIVAALVFGLSVVPGRSTGASTASAPDRSAPEGAAVAHPES
jgi:hypothetical protein